MQLGFAEIADGFSIVVLALVRIGFAGRNARHGIALDVTAIQGVGKQCLQGALVRAVGGVSQALERLQVLFDRSAVHEANGLGAVAADEAAEVTLIVSPRASRNFRAPQERSSNASDGYIGMTRSILHTAELTEKSKYSWNKF